MLFWFKKALTIPFLPLYFSLLTGAFGSMLLWTRRPKLGRVLITVAVLSLTAFSNKGVALFLLGSLETRFAPIPEIHAETNLPAQIAGCRTIVILGGGHSNTNELSRVNQLSTSALGRLTEGVRLAHLLPNSKLIVSGYNGPKELSHAQILAEAAISLGVAPDRIIRFDATRDTDDEAQELARRLGLEPFLLVTSAWHMPRAMALCVKAGLQPIAAPADYQQRPGEEISYPFLSWDLGALEMSTKAIHERLGLLWAKLRNHA